MVLLESGERLLAGEEITQEEPRGVRQGPREIGVLHVCRCRPVAFAR
jgi:hypothetical protein